MLEDKLKDYINEKFGSVRNFAMKIDIPYTTVDSILRRGIDNSNVGNVIKMCKALDISVDSLLDSKEIISKLSFDNATLIDTNADVETIQIPVLGVIKAGLPIEAQENILDYIEIPREWIKGGKQFYGLKISGNSMSPKYMPNDIVVFEQTNNFEEADNKDACVMVNGYDATFKKFNINLNGITLTPLNLENEDGYLPTFYNIEQIQNLPVKVIGIAKRRISDIE